MRIPVVPVTNGMIPRPSQELTGVFLDDWVKEAFAGAGEGGMAILLPYDPETGLYPVGAIVSVEDAWRRNVIVSPSFTVREAMFAHVTGKGTVKAGAFEVRDGALLAADAKMVDLNALRKTYPLIDGAGWTALEGSTEARSKEDIRVEIYGASHDGEQVVLRANLGSLVSPETAHTVEHAVIRSLSRCAMATPRTMREALAGETRDLKDSLTVGYKLRMPEFFGVTPTGMCGNPLTGLAHFYLQDEFMKNLERGESLPRSIQNARLSALSHVTDDLELSTQRGSRVLQGLKLGMMHDDSRIPDEKIRAILRRFPLSPWE